MPWTHLLPPFSRLHVSALLCYSLSPVSHFSLSAGSFPWAFKYFQSLLIKNGSPSSISCPAPVIILFFILFYRKMYWKFSPCFPSSDHTPVHSSLVSIPTIPLECFSQGHQWSWQEPPSHFQCILSLMFLKFSTAFDADVGNTVLLNTFSPDFYDTLF